jgi:hypothetical protein
VGDARATTLKYTRQKQAEEMNANAENAMQQISAAKTTAKIGKEELVEKQVNQDKPQKTLLPKQIYLN